MGVLDNLKGILAQYTPGAPAPPAAEAHFDEVARSADPGTLAHGIAAALHSDQTPPFADIVSKLFAGASPEQKAGMLNTLLASATPEQRAQVAAMIPGASAGSTSVSGAQADAVPADAVSSLAGRLQQGGAAVVDKMSAFYAQHPGLVKALGTTALVIAMRRIAERHR